MRECGKPGKMKGRVTQGKEGGEGWVAKDMGRRRDEEG
jgi:hypothetical protein